MKDRVSPSHLPAKVGRGQVKSPSRTLVFMALAALFAGAFLGLFLPAAGATPGGNGQGVAAAPAGGAPASPPGAPAAPSEGLPAVVPALPAALPEAAASSAPVAPVAPAPLPLVPEAEEPLPVAPSNVSLEAAVEPVVAQTSESPPVVAAPQPAAAVEAPVSAPVATPVSVSSPVAVAESPQPSQPQVQSVSYARSEFIPGPAAPGPAPDADLDAASSGQASAQNPWHEAQSVAAQQEPVEQHGVPLPVWATWALCLFIVEIGLYSSWRALQSLRLPASAAWIVREY